MNRIRKTFLAFALLLAGCAGSCRECSSSMATSFGADWIVVQYGTTGAPIHCWRLPSTSIANEAHSDGIYWQAPSGHLVHISGWYNRVQVSGGEWQSAATDLGIDLGACRQ